MTFKNIFTVISILFLAISCKPKFDVTEPSFGDINPSNFVAIGGSSTAGFSDGALNLNGQENSYISILSTQLNLIGSVRFNQPLVSSTGINLDGNSRLIMGYKTDCKGVTSLSPIRESISGDNTILGANIFGSTGTYNNLGTPDIGILDVNKVGFGNSLSGSGNFNPFYSRIASDEINGTVLNDALAQNPTFFTVRLGEQDILNAATNGESNSIPPASGGVGVGFDGSLDEILSNLSGSGANGMIASIPNVLNYPFFTTIPYNGLNINIDQANDLNAIFNPIGITFQVGENAFTIEDPSTPFNVRKMVPGELILLSVPLDSVKCLGMGSINPIPGEYVLTLGEIDSINNRISEYNSAIYQVASTYGVATVDISSTYNGFNEGTVYNGISLTTEFVSGGTFSLDGLNLTPRGQAIIANEFIKKMNTQFNANVPQADATKYPGIIFP